MQKQPIKNTQIKQKNQKSYQKVTDHGQKNLQKKVNKPYNTFFQNTSNKTNKNWKNQQKNFKKGQNKWTLHKKAKNKWIYKKKFKFNPKFKSKLYGRPFRIFRKKVFRRLKRYSFFTFNVYPNNVFCTLKKFENKKFFLLNTASSRKYKIYLSKKTLKYKAKFVILSFLKEIKQKKIRLKKTVGIKLIAPIRLRKMIIKIVSTELKGKNFMFESIGKKVFNGCRALKKIRKKRKGLRLFK